MSPEWLISILRPGARPRVDWIGNDWSTRLEMFVQLTVRSTDLYYRKRCVHCFTWCPGNAYRYKSFDIRLHLLCGVASCIFTLVPWLCSGWWGLETYSLWNNWWRTDNFEVPEWSYCAWSKVSYLVHKCISIWENKIRSISFCTMQGKIISRK